jgi:hypothetical protein
MIADVGNQTTLTNRISSKSRAYLLIPSGRGIFLLESTMIEGFKLRVTCTELMNHCMERAGYHAKRADTKEAELPSLRRSMEALTKSPQQINSSYNLQDPIEQLETDISDHRSKCSTFTFFAEHLFEEDYTLHESDLVRLEFVKR